jgi:hypothetical protein
VIVVDGNLDCEARWAGVTLPAAVLRRISAAATLLGALVDGDEVELWTPAAIDLARVARIGDLPTIISRIGTPPRADLAWARVDAAARRANDRRTALALTTELGVALPGACVLADRAALLAHLAAGGAAASAPGRWVVKAPWTAAGRDRFHGEPGPLTPADATRLDRMFARFGALMFEPWMDRVDDLGVCARIVDGEVHARPPHRLRSDARGGFVGIDLAPPALTPSDRARLDAVVDAVGHRLASLGYAGPFTVDAFHHVVGGARHLHPLCEINARLSFGVVAHALGARLGATGLGFGPAPAGATVLLAPVEGDPVTAWIVGGPPAGSPPQVSA